MKYHALENLINLYDGYRKAFRVSSYQLLLIQVQNTPYLIENRCPHQNSPLQQGVVIGETIRCPLHGFEFCLRTGRHSLNTCQAIKVFEVVYEGNSIGVML